MKIVKLKRQRPGKENKGARTKTRYGWSKNWAGRGVEILNQVETGKSLGTGGVKRKRDVGMRRMLTKLVKWDPDNAFYKSL